MAGLRHTLTEYSSPSGSLCDNPRVSPSNRPIRAAIQLKFTHVSVLSLCPSLVHAVERKPLPAISFVQSICFIQLLHARKKCHIVAAQDQRVFGGVKFLRNFSMGIPCSRYSAIAGMRDRPSKVYRMAGGRKFNLEERIRQGVEKSGLEKQFRELPLWSAYVPIMAGGLEALVMLSWTVGLQGRLLGIFNISGEGLLTLVLGINFVVGWLASQISTWRVNSLFPSMVGQEKKAISPGRLDFVRSFFVSIIPYGNFLAWTRFAWKENSSVSSLNAVVYVLPSLLRLILWSQGLGIGRVERIAWLLGTIHRPYDAARVHNERLLATVDTKKEDIQKAKEREQREKERELSVEEMAVLQQRKELEEFDILLAKSRNGISSIPGRPEDWSVRDTAQWLAREGFARYASTFADNDIDGATLLQLTTDDLRNELGIQSLGDRKKLGQAIEHLKM